MRLQCDLRNSKPDIMQTNILSLSLFLYLIHNLTLCFPDLEHQIQWNDVIRDVIFYRAILLRNSTLTFLSLMF